MSDPNARGPWFLRELVANALQAWLLHAVQERCGPDIFFLQIGANDGSTHDPLKDRVRFHKWRGILVEPVPHLNAALQVNYRDCEGLIFVQAACAEAPGSLPFYQIKNEEQHLWDGLRGLSSFTRDIIRSHFTSDAEFDRFVEPVTLEVVTAEQLLSRYPSTHVHLLLIDTEGADARVLDGFDVEARRPEIVMIEHLHLSIEDRTRVARRMHSAGYRKCVGAMDTFFYQPSLCGVEELDTLAVFQNPVLSLR